MHTKTQDRKGLIAKIHVGQSQLQMDNDSYRALLQRLTKKNSCTEMTLVELEAVLKELKRLGFTPKRAGTGRKPNVAKSKAALLSKIEAILAEKKLPWQYAEAMAKRMFKREAIEWLNAAETHKLLQALIYHQRRHAAKGEQ